MNVSIDKVKKHLNLDEFYNEDNDYLVQLVCAAESAIAKRLNVKELSHLINPDTGYLPEDIIHAVLLLCGNWYANREAVSNLNVNKLPFGLEFICDMNKNYNYKF